MDIKSKMETLDDVYYERIVSEELEPFLKYVCINWPTQEKDEKHKKINQRDLLTYSLGRHSDDPSLIKMTYHNKHSFPNRKVSDGVSLQRMPRTLRRRLVGGKCSNNCDGECKCIEQNAVVIDIDQVNSHPTIQHQILQKMRIAPVRYRFISDYTQNRSAVLERLGVEKTDVLSALNNERLVNPVLSNDPAFRDYHNVIYGNEKKEATFFSEFNLLNPHVCKQAHTASKKKCEKQKKDNLKGSWFSHLMNYQESLLTDAFKIVFTEMGYTVRSLQFDGFHVDYDVRINQQVLDEATERVYQTTGFRMPLSIKSLNTNWVPEFSDEPMVPVEELNAPFDRIKARDLLKEIWVWSQAGKIRVPVDVNVFDKSEFSEYMSKHVAIVRLPNAMTFRKRINDPWRVMSRREANDILDTWFHLSEKRGLYDVAEAYAKHSHKREFDKIDIFIDYDTNDTSEENIMNLYVRPPTPKGIGEEIWDKVPLLKYYLLNILCDGDTSLFGLLIDYITKMVKSGRTELAWIFFGRKGTGKSFFHQFFLRPLIGREYYHSTDDINTIERQFTGHLKSNIVFAVDELSCEAGTYNKIQQILKSKITNDVRNVEPKYVDQYETRNTTNIIFTMNDLGGVKITNDNRRFQPSKVSEEWRGNESKFSELERVILENIEDLRGYFAGRPTPGRLRPINTAFTRYCMRASEMPHEEFVRTELDIIWSNSTSNVVDFVSKHEIYEKFTIFHNSVSGQKKTLISWDRMKKMINDTSDKYKIVKGRDNENNRFDKMVLRAGNEHLDDTDL
jgi:hypothetical protein